MNIPAMARVQIINRSPHTCLNALKRDVAALRVCLGVA